MAITTNYQESSQISYLEKQPELGSPLGSIDFLISGQRHTRTVLQYNDANGIATAVIKFDVSSITNKIVSAESSIWASNFKMYRHSFNEYIAYELSKSLGFHVAPRAVFVAEKIEATAQVFFKEMTGFNETLNIYQPDLQHYSVQSYIQKGQEASTYNGSIRDQKVKLFEFILGLDDLYQKRNLIRDTKGDLYPVDLELVGAKKKAYVLEDIKLDTKEMAFILEIKPEDISNVLKKIKEDCGFAWPNYSEMETNMHENLRNAQAFLQNL